MFLDRTEAESLTRRVLEMSRAEACEVSLQGDEGCNIRLASRGGMSNGTGGSISVAITSGFGQRVGHAVTNSVDNDALREAVARSEAAAKLSPKNPEAMPPLGPQTYPSSAAYDETTARLGTADLADLLAPAVEQARKSNLDFALFSYANRAWRTYGSSAGALAYDRMTKTSLTMTARNRRGTWSGWGGSNVNHVGRLDPAAIVRAAIDKASAQPDPVALEPGKYVALLEPAVVAQMVGYMMWGFDARPADEGRSFLSRPGGTKLGERLFDPRIRLTSDPASVDAPGLAVSRDGMPNRPVAWIDGGAVTTLVRSRYWAKNMGGAPVARPDFYALQGGTDSVADLIRDVKRGVLVTRLWYVRLVDPRTLVVTGLTRDGTFLIENGAVTRPISNFRFNESPLAVFGNVLGIGPAQRAQPSEDTQTLYVPPLLVKDFTFSSISPAV